MTDLAELRAAYRSEFGRYERLARWVEDRLLAALVSTEVMQPEVKGRAKDVPSFLKKALRPEYTDPLRQITDKAGVRVLLCLVDEVALVEDLIHASFEVLEHQNKADQLEPDRLGYLGVHFLVTPRGDDLTSDDLDLEGAICEIQIHTRAQNAWSSVNHRLVYKPGKDPAPAVKRRINRLVALVELFDAEVAAAREAVLNDSDYRQSAMLQTLEREFMHIARRDFDPRLSLLVLDALKDAYREDELASFDALITDFMRSRRSYLTRILDETDPEISPMLFQPEAIAVLERLEHAKERLRAAWDGSLPPRLLDSLSEELGRPA